MHTRCAWQGRPAASPVLCQQLCGSFLLQPALLLPAFPALVGAAAARCQLLLLRLAAAARHRRCGGGGAAAGASHCVAAGRRNLHGGAYCMPRFSPRLPQHIDGPVPPLIGHLRSRTEQDARPGVRGCGCGMVHADAFACSRAQAARRAAASAPQPAAGRHRQVDAAVTARQHATRRTLRGRLAAYGVAASCPSSYGSPGRRPPGSCPAAGSPGARSGGRQSRLAAAAAARSPCRGGRRCGSRHTDAWGKPHVGHGVLRAW